MALFIRRLVAFACRNSIAVIILISLLTIFFGFAASKLVIDPNVDSLIPDNAEIKLIMDKYRRSEASGDYLIVAIHSDAPYSVEGLNSFAKMISDIEAIPGILPGISPFNLMSFEIIDGRVSVAPLSPGGGPPQDRNELLIFTERLMATPYAENLLRSSDGTVLAAYFPTELIDDFAGLMNSVRTVTSRADFPHTVHISGSIPFVERTELYLARDFAKLAGFAALVILFFYYLGFRTVRGIVFPFLVVVLGTTWSMGFMALSGFSLSLVNIIIPPVVLALGSSYSIHILNQYYRSTNDGATSKAEWVPKVVETVNTTVILAAATTIAGFASLFATDIRQLREFALSASFGIATCAILSLFFLPALLSRLNGPKTRQVQRVRTGALSVMLLKIGDIVYKYRVPIAAASLAVPALFAFSMGRIDTNTDTIAYFPQNDPVVEEMYFMTEYLGGFDEVNITFTAPENEARYFLDPAVLAEMAALEQQLMDIPDITYVSSFTTYLRAMNMAISGSDDVPASRAPVLLLSRYLKVLTADSSGGLMSRPLHNEDFSQLTLSFRVYNSHTKKFIDERGLRRLLKEMENVVGVSSFKSFESDVWGMGLQYLSLADMLRQNLLKSMLISLAAVFLLSAFSFRSVRYGLLTLIPLATGVMLNFILMAIVRIPLDMTTIMVSSIAVGVGVDDAIHFLIHYRQSSRTSTQPVALRLSLEVTGRPILLTTLSIVGGFIILALASFRPIEYFGLLVAFTLSAACASTILILPAFASITYSLDRLVRKGGAQ